MKGSLCFIWNESWKPIILPCSCIRQFFAIPLNIQSSADSDDRDLGVDIKKEGDF